MKKDTIYIDIEDDITAIIDKAKSAKAKIVALVPPKRSTALNSAVNMKLLLKSAEESQKRVVLVTNEASLLGLAGGVGMYIAPNLHSKPYVPEDSAAPAPIDSVIDGSEIDSDSSIGELSDVHAASSQAGEGKPPDAGGKPAKSRFKIPSFDKFRNRMFLAIGAVLLLILGWWWAFWLAPRALIAIQAQTTAVDVAFEFTADTSAGEDDFEDNHFTAETIELEKTLVEQFTPTGKKNVGEKATGQMTIRNEDGVSYDIAGGTIFTSPGGFKFESLESTTVPEATVCPGGGVCPGESDVSVRAISPGTDYNLPDGTEYDIDGVGSLVYGIGGQMSGGTDKNVTVVAQKDVDAARKRLAEVQEEEGIADLREGLDEDMVPVNETLRVDLGDVVALPSVGQEAETGSVSAEATLSMMAIPRDTLAQALEDFLSSRLEGGDQVIYDNGLDGLVFTRLEGPGNGRAELRLSTTGHIGPDLDTVQLARDIEGMRYSEALNYIKARPGVIEVDVNFEPFWVFSAPRPDRIEFNLNVGDSAS